MDEIPYRQVVESLMYAVQVSRPDIAFQVSCIAKYIADPRPSHWQNVYSGILLERWITGLESFREITCQVDFAMRV